MPSHRFALLENSVVDNGLTAPIGALSRPPTTSIV
jgi:hypothetical protein